LKVSLSTTVPDASRLGKAELVYRHRAAAFTTIVKGLKTTPTLELSANFGSDKLSAGASVVYDSQANVVSDVVAGVCGTAQNPPSLSPHLHCIAFANFRLHDGFWHRNIPICKGSTRVGIDKIAC
jgi:hypothetical protein